MSHTATVRATARRTRTPTVAGLAVLIAAILGTLSYQSAASSASSFGDAHAGVANLDPDLRKALREAATDAARDGVEVQVNSGWRSPEYQNRLFREAITKYGSAEEAARWVATAETSAHVSGDAVDIGRADATAWLSENGARYGLCQIYGNE